MAGTTGSIGSDAAELERVVLPNAVTDELLEQLRSVCRSRRVTVGEQRVPGVFEDDEKTLGGDLFLASFTRCDAEQLAELGGVASVGDGVAEDAAQRAECIGVE
jgi:hypothetical protein